MSYARSATCSDQRHSLTAKASATLARSILDEQRISLQGVQVAGVGMRTSCQSQSATRAKNAALMEHEDFDPSDANDNKHADYYPGMLYFRHHLSDGSQHNCWSRDGRQWLEQDDNVLEF